MTDANLSYRTSSSRSTTGVGLVILLYEQLVQDLRRAATAMDAGDVEARTFELSHALEVVGQLQGKLDMHAGADVAQNLDRFYTALQAGILEAQIRLSHPILRRLIDDVLSVREAWLDVERATLSVPQPAESSPVAKSEFQQPPTASSGKTWKV